MPFAQRSVPFLCGSILIEGHACHWRQVEAAAKEYTRREQSQLNKPKWIVPIGDFGFN
jgi:hypothetical protein